MVKVGDKVRSTYYSDDPKGDVFTVVDVEGGYISATCDAGCNYSDDDYIWCIPQYHCDAIPPNPLQYFTMNALVEAVSKAIDAGDTQSARAIIDAMEAKQ